MSRAGGLIIDVVLFSLLVVGVALGIRYYVHVQYDAGYEAGHAAAVAAGNAQRDLDAAIHLKKETDLRDQLAAKDVDAHRKEQEYATNLEAAQRRVRAGTDRLRCPAANPVQPATAASDRPIASGPATDGEGPTMVPDDSAALLGLVADHQRLMQRYERVVERFDDCRAMNAVP